MTISTDYKCFHCRCCRAQLALTNGARLLFGVGAYTDEPTAIKCGHCGLRQLWKPVREEMIDTLAIGLYTERQPA